jgi:hypothetical protein
MKTQIRIEMTRKNLKSVSGFNFDETKLAEACKNEYIPNGAFIMANGEEKVYFENETFVTKKDGKIIKSITKSSISESAQEQLFCIWAGNQAKN